MKKDRTDLGAEELAIVGGGEGPLWGFEPSPFDFAPQERWLGQQAGPWTGDTGVAIGGRLSERFDTPWPSPDSNFGLFHSQNDPMWAVGPLSEPSDFGGFDFSPRGMSGPPDFDFWSQGF